VFNAWIIREVAARLRQPGMKTQRRFVLIVALVLALFLCGALLYLFRQPTNDAMESAALKVFAAFGALIAILISLAVLVRKKTAARWTKPPIQNSRD
jgi:Na+/proline symporter